MNKKEIFLHLDKNRKKVLSVCPNAKESSGIYAYERYHEEIGLVAYIGQSKNVLQRLASHFLPISSDHLARSLCKHGIENYDITKPPCEKWRVKVIVYAKESELDDLEKRYIEEYKKHFTVYNIMGGGQGKGRIVNRTEPHNKSTKWKSFGRSKVISEINEFIRKSRTKLIPETRTETQRKNFQKLLDVLGESKSEANNGD